MGTVRTEVMKWLSKDFRKQALAFAGCVTLCLVRLIRTSLRGANAVVLDSPGLKVDLN